MRRKADVVTAVRRGLIAKHSEHRTKLGGFLRNENGISAIIFAICLPVFVATAALAFDMGYAYLKRTDLQTTASASSLLSRLARDNLDADRTAPPASKTASASGLAAMPSAETGQDAAPGRTARLESDATLQPRVAVRAPEPEGRALVRAIQERLSDRGYYEGPLDGNLGPKTRQAIQVYQRVQRYQATGQPTRALHEELEDYALDALALNLFQKGSYDAAIATYTLIIQRKPKSADAYFNRGLAQKVLGRTDQALSNYEIAIALDPAHRRPGSTTQTSNPALGTIC